MALLEVRDLSLTLGGQQILRDLTLTVRGGRCTPWSVRTGRASPRWPMP